MLARLSGYWLDVGAAVWLSARCWPAPSPPPATSYPASAGFVVMCTKTVDKTNSARREPQEHSEIGIQMLLTFGIKVYRRELLGCLAEEFNAKR